MYKLKSDLFYYSHKVLKVVKMDSFIYRGINPIDHIVDNIYLGDFRAADDINILREHGITHIINCPEYLPEQFPNNIKYLSLNLKDDLYQDLTYAIDSSLQFINSGEKIFIHCRQGMSRSVAIVIAYLIYFKGMEYTDALILVKSKRAIANLNIYFAKQLRELCDTIKRKGFADY